MAKVIKTHCVTNEVRLAYPHVWEPYTAPNGNGVAYYTACLLIPKSDTETIDAINEAIDNAIESTSVFGGRKVNKASMRSPLRDGDVDREGKDIYAGCYFINAKSKFAPQVVDGARCEIKDQNAIYPGVYANVILNFYCYSNNGNKGIGCGLGNIQKTRDGERLGGDALNFDAISEPKTESEGLPF